MLNVKNILFPTDFSESAEKAFLAAEPLLKRFGAKLHVFHLISWHGREVFSQSEYGLPMPSQRRILDKFESDAKEKIAEFVKMDPDFYVQMVDESDEPASANIVEYAAENDIDLIVVGTRGGREIYRHLVGGTLENILAKSPVPVFAVGHDATFGSDFNSILVPIDLSENSAKLIETAGKYAKALEASVTLLHVVTPQDTALVGSVGLDPIPIMLPPDFETPKKLLTRLAEDILGDYGIDYDISVVAGHPDMQIEKAAADLNVDLIVVATHGHTGVKRLFLGSSARHIVHHAPCPVLVLNSNCLDTDDS